MEYTRQVSMCQERTYSSNSQDTVLVHDYAKVHPAEYVNGKTQLGNRFVSGGGGEEHAETDISLTLV